MASSSAVDKPKKEGEELLKVVRQEAQHWLKGMQTAQTAMGDVVLASAKEDDEETLRLMKLVVRTLKRASDLLVSSLDIQAEPMKSFNGMKETNKLIMLRSRLRNVGIQNVKSY